jgi:hypothetical protein
VKCLQLALVTSPNAVKDTALLQLANILANVGALADALTLVNRAAAVARPSHALHYLRGRLLLDVGDDAGALEAFEQAVEAQPELMAAHVMRRDLTHRVKGLAAPTRRQYEIDLRKITMVLPFNLTWEDYEYEVCGSILSSSSHCSPLLLFLLSAHHSLSFSLLSPLLSLYARLIFFVLDLLLLYSRALSRNDSFITRCPRARARARAHAHSHAHTHTHTRTLARTRTHTHTHTHIRCTQIVVDPCKGVTCPSNTECSNEHGGCACAEGWRLGLDGCIEDIACSAVVCGGRNERCYGGACVCDPGYDRSSSGGGSTNSLDEGGECVKDPCA